MLGADRPPALPDKVAAALDRIARVTRTERQAFATDAGVTPLQLDLLQVIADGAPPSPSIGRLADEVAVTQPTATDSIRALVDKGLVVRITDPEDRRRTRIEITPSGRLLVAAGARSPGAVSAAVAALAPARQAEVLEVLLALIAGLVDQGLVGVARTCLTCCHHRLVGSTHRCLLLAAELTSAELRVNCPEHRAA